MCQFRDEIKTMWSPCFLALTSNRKSYRQGDGTQTVFYFALEQSLILEFCLLDTKTPSSKPREAVSHLNSYAILLPAILLNRWHRVPFSRALQLADVALKDSNIKRVVQYPGWRGPFLYSEQKKHGSQCVSMCVTCMMFPCDEAICRGEAPFRGGRGTLSPEIYKLMVTFKFWYMKR